MNLDDILRDESRRWHQFPVCEHKTFLAHAGVCPPLPRCVTEAIQRYLDAAGRDDQEDALPARIVGETRHLAAQLLEVNSEEISFTSSTSMGLGLVAAGLDWQAGDNIVCYRDDYPANVYPWMALAERGVTVRFVEPRVYGRVKVEEIEKVVDKRTRLVALASVHFVSGWRLDTDQIGSFLHERGILFCLDGIQSFGALRTSLRHVDFAAADAHKWLLGPLGIALLFVRRENLDRLRPALSMNLGYGTEAVEERVLMLSRTIVEGGQALGRAVIGPTTTGESGIVAFALSNEEKTVIKARLEQTGIVASIRAIRGGNWCLRLSPHFYNLKREIDIALSALTG